MANTITPGQAFSFGQQPNFGVIPEATTDSTDFKISVPASLANVTDLTTLDVTVNIVDSNDATLGLTLIAPSGDTFTLLLNQIPVPGGTADPGIGMTGSDLGVKTYTNNDIATYAMGTTFDDNATRDIFDPTGAGTNNVKGPAVGDYRPENGGTLDAFLRMSLARASTASGRSRPTTRILPRPARQLPQISSLTGR